MFLERLKAAPRGKLERLAAFLKLLEPVVWRDDLGHRNLLAERLRKCWWWGALVSAPGLTAVRRHIVLQRWRNGAKGLWRMGQRPTLPPQVTRLLGEIYDRDLERLGGRMSVGLSSKNFSHTVTHQSLLWKRAVRQTSERASAS